MADTIKITKSFGPVVARVLLSTVFLMSGFSKILDFSGQVAFTANVLPFPETMIVIAIIFEVFGGLMLLFGYRARLGAGMLFVFTLVATVAFHSDISDPIQEIMATKNLAIMGGLLLVAMQGAGMVSFDRPDVEV